MSDIQSQVEAVLGGLLEAYDRGELSEWADDVLDVQYTIGGDGQYLGVTLLVCFGGPNILVDTDDCVIRGYWGGYKASTSIPDEIVDELDEIFIGFFDCLPRWSR